MSAEQAAGLTMNTFIRDGTEFYASEENITSYPFDPKKGKALLDDAGWILEKGAEFRTNDFGDPLSIQLTNTLAAFRQVWTAVWEKQMNNCGISIVCLYSPAAWWFGDAIVLGFTQDPDSLYTAVLSMFTSQLAVQLIAPCSYLSLNYVFTPQMVEELSILEDGLALNNDITVKAGDNVIDTTGEVVELAHGVKVLDVTGAEVDYTGADITMKQVIITHKFRNDLTWSDGTKLNIEDFKLGYKVGCDRENVSTTFYTYDHTLDVAFADDAANHC